MNDELSWPRRLARWSLTLAARNEQQLTFEDATALRGGVSRWLLEINSNQTFEDATALRGGVSRWLLEINSNQLLKMPPPCAVESHVGC